MAETSVAITAGSGTPIDAFSQTGGNLRRRTAGTGTGTGTNGLRQTRISGYGRGVLSVNVERASRTLRLACKRGEQAEPKITP